ncbi:PREDICTED: odorant receptor 13a-like [Wasmannia auropunctata]|uniref:odorant receptor 13a-like n=1 Tax=Wasmannia auropunctata TaxID=64793 RepID=UPI0005F0AA22|nr:PREDICTED: odorant receptor 13a-like [Wasmannia auropunctata]
MQFSFAALESPFFECILAWQIFYLITLASVVGMINALLATLILHVGGQIDIMRQAIMEVHSNDELGTSLTVLSDLIHRHRKIINLSDDIENLFSTIGLLQLLWNTLIICCMGFMIILALGNNKGVLIKSLFLYIAKTLEVFVFCYAGEFLSFKSKLISDAVYESHWYNMVPSDSRILLFIMMRSQKRLTITAGKIFDLTLEGFMSVMKASASYMSVLHAAY